MLKETGHVKVKYWDYLFFLTEMCPRRLSVQFSALPTLDGNIIKQSVVHVVYM